MDCFYALADLDEGVRHQAALDVISYFRDKEKHGPNGASGLQKSYQDNVSYAVKRLVRGLGSSRGCARQGFSLALGELLRLRVEGSSDSETLKKKQKKKKRSKVVGPYVVPDLTQVITVIERENVVNGSQRGQEERDLLLANVSGAVSVIRSGRLHEADELPVSVLRLLMRVAGKKTWLQQMCYEAVAAALGVSTLDSSCALEKEEASKSERLSVLRKAVTGPELLPVFEERLLAGARRRQTNREGDAKQEDEGEGDEDTLSTATPSATLELGNLDAEQLQLALILNRFFCATGTIDGKDGVQLGPLSKLDAKSGTDILSKPKVLQSLMTPLLESARFNTGIHAVWDHLIHYCIDPWKLRPERTAMLPKVWDQLVCGNVVEPNESAQGLLNTTHQRRVLAFRLFQKIFLHTSLAETRYLPIRSSLFTAKFLRSLASHIAAVDSHLHREALRIIKAIKGEAERAGMSARMAFVGAIMQADPLFDTHAAPRYKNTSKKAEKRRRKKQRIAAAAAAAAAGSTSHNASSTSTPKEPISNDASIKDKGLVASLLSGLDAPAVSKYIAFLRGQFLSGVSRNAGETGNTKKSDVDVTNSDKDHLRAWTADALFALCRNSSMPGHSKWAPGVRKFLFCQAFFRCKNTKDDPESTPDAALEGGRAPVLSASSPVRNILAQRTLSLLTAGTSEQQTHSSASTLPEEAGAASVVLSVRESALELHKLWKSLRSKKVALARPLSQNAEASRKKVDSLLKSIKTTIKHESVRQALESLVLLFEIQLLFNDNSLQVSSGQEGISTVSDDAAADLEELGTVLAGESGLVSESKRRRKNSTKRAMENDESLEAKPKPIDVLVDLLLSLLMRPASPCQRLLRDLSRSLFATLSAAKLLNNRSCVLTMADTFLSNNLQVGNNDEDDDSDDGDDDGDADINMDPDDEDEFKPIDPAVVAAIKAKWKAEERAAGVDVISSDDENGEEEEDVVISDTKDLARVMIGEEGLNDGSKDAGYNSTNKQGSSGSGSGSGSDSDSEDPNNDTGLFGQSATEMMMNAFNLLSKRTKRDQAKALLADEATFKLRVADLLEVWIKRNEISPYVPAALFMPLVRAIVLLTLKTQKNLLERGNVNLNNRKDVNLLELESALLTRLRAVLTKRVLGKGRDYPRGDVIAAYSEGGSDGFANDVHNVLEECCNVAVRGFGNSSDESKSSSLTLQNTTGNHPEILQLLSLSIIYMCRVLRGTSKDGKSRNVDENSWGMLRENLAKSLLVDNLLFDFVSRKSSRLTEDFFSTLITRLAPIVGRVLVLTLAKLVEESNTDIAAEKEKQNDKIVRAQKVEEARQAARASGASKKAVERAAKKAGIAADAEVASRINAAKKKKSTNKRKKGETEWLCRSQFQRGVCTRLSVIAVRSGAARGHESALIDATNAAVTDVEAAGNAGVKVRSDLVTALVDLCEVLAGQIKKTSANEETLSIPQVKVSALGAAAASLVGIVKSARGLQKRSHTLKKIERVQKKLGKNPAKTNSSTNSKKVKKSKRRKTKK